MSTSNNKLYKKLPAFVREIGKWGYSRIPLKIRNGQRFYKQLEFLEKSQWWSIQELENYQNEELRKLIKHAYENVLYYNKLFKENKLHPSDIKTTRDLPKIPFLSKDMVRQNSDMFIAGNYKKKSLVHISTSGTSGKILDVYSDPQNEFINGGPFEWRFFRWGGYAFEDYCAVFRAQFLEQQSSKNDHIFQFNPVQKKVFFSIYDIEEKVIDKYLLGLRKYPLKIIQSYPAPLKKLADILIGKNIPAPFRLKMINTVAELVTPEQRKVIEGYFACNIFDWYGMEERAVLACECEKHTGLHVNPDFGIIEFIKNPGDENGYEIIATGLTNYAMPFIRYKTGDCAMPIDKSCACGRSFPLIKILGGRNRYFVEDSDGSFQAVVGFLDSFSDVISQFQYVVKEKGELEIRVVPKDTYTAQKENIILNNLKTKYRDKFQICIKPVPEIKMQSGGKTPLVISESEQEILYE